MSRKSKEAEFFAEQNHALKEKLENLNFDNGENLKTIELLEGEVDHYKSEEYHMEVRVVIHRL